MTPGVVRCGEHADYGTLTFLMQDDLGGLEVRDLDQGWIKARPVKGSILVICSYISCQGNCFSHETVSQVNVGDLMEIITNGRIPATRHRVVVPEEEVRERKY